MAVAWVKDQAAWDREFHSRNGMLGKDMQQRGRTLASLARSQVGKDTFELVKSIKSTLGHRAGELEVTVGSSVKHARMHHDGTDPHVIRARRAKHLRFVQNGRVVYATVVNHPGTKPNRYLTDNLGKVIPA